MAIFLQVISRPFPLVCHGTVAVSLCKHNHMWQTVQEKGLTLLLFQAQRISFSPSALLQAIPQAHLAPYRVEVLGFFVEESEIDPSDSDEREVHKGHH